MTRRFEQPVLLASVLVIPTIIVETSAETAITGLGVLGGAAAFQAAERAAADPPTLWDSVWWATTTVTTVGYGDISPATTLGRVIGIALMLLGIGFVALLTGALAQRLLQVDAERIEQAETRVEAEEHAIAQELQAIAQRIVDLERRVTARERIAPCER